MRDLVIATGNEGKIKEFQKLLVESSFNVLGLRDVGIITDVEEPAQTFEGNALIKAMTYGRLSNKLTLAEDSGLEIDALDGRPGVHTKRYVADTPDQGHARIIKEMKDVPEANRGAQFKSIIALYDPQTDKVRTCEGVARGIITHEPRGTHGFGQDPIFQYDETGRTGGEMTLEEKNAISQRGKAMAKAKEILLNEFV